MKIWSSEHVFNHTWENVVKAALQKYPNPLTPGVIGVDVVDRKIEGDSIQTHRLMMTQWNVAPWISKLIGGNKTCYASEHSQVNRNTKTLSLRSRNLTFDNIINVDEKLEYSVHPEDNEKTILKQEAVITVQNVPLIDYLENTFISRMNVNAQTGRQAIEFVIHQMNNISDDMNKITDNLANITQANLANITNSTNQRFNLKN